MNNLRLHDTLAAAIGAGVLLGVVKYVHLLMALTGGEWLHLLRSTAATFVRVVTAVALASLWTIPVGVMIGRHPRWSRVFQPVIQMAASFPAPMILPVVVGAMLASGIGLGISSVVLLLLGTQWYILFNVIAGSSAIPRELWEVSRLARALAVEPEILCMDEPCSALDVLTSETLRNEVTDLYTSKTSPVDTILMVTHSLSEGVFMATRLVRGESTLVLPR